MEKITTHSLDEIRSFIKNLRLNNGYSMEYMSFELDISVATYFKIENGKTKLTLRRFLELKRILKFSLIDILPLFEDRLGEKHESNLQINEKETEAEKETKFDAIKTEIGLLRSELAQFSEDRIVR